MCICKVSCPYPYPYPFLSLYPLIFSFVVMVQQYHSPIPYCKQQSFIAEYNDDDVGVADEW